jgi:cysteine synthase
MSITPVSVTSKLKALSRLVGNTPLLTLHFRYRGRERVLYAKSEYLSLTGSIKDRMALRILQQAYADGAIELGHTIAEATSGNTGIAFAALGRMLGHPVKIFMPDWMSQERVQLIRSYGAEVVSVSKADGGLQQQYLSSQAVFQSRKHAGSRRDHRAGNLVAVMVDR